MKKCLLIAWKSISDMVKAFFPGEYMFKEINRIHITLETWDSINSLLL